MTRDNIRNLVNNYVLPLKRDYENDIDDLEAEEIVPGIIKRIVRSLVTDTRKLEAIFVRAVKEGVERKFGNDDISDEEIHCLCQKYYDSVSSYADIIFGNAIIEILGNKMVEEVCYIENDNDELPRDLRKDIEKFAFRKWHNIDLSRTISSFRVCVVGFFYDLLIKYDGTYLEYRW